MADQTVYSIATDLKEAEAMAKNLVPYVHQDQLYGRVGGGGMFAGGAMPSLTIGALLMRLRRLRVFADRLDRAQLDRLEDLEERNTGVFKEWRAHYEAKLLKEAQSRLDAIKQFFDECDSDPRLCASVYRPEALRRTIVQEILIAMQEIGLSSDDVVRKARAVDARLRRYVTPADFLWAAELQPAYPEETFWWLYNRPPAR